MISDAVFKYQGAFHDGSVNAIEHSSCGTEIWMNSSQILPNEMRDNIPLSNFGTINGKLHLEGIQSITKNEESISQFTMEGYAWGEYGF